MVRPGAVRYRYPQRQSPAGGFHAGLLPGPVRTSLWHQDLRPRGTDGKTGRQGEEETRGVGISFRRFAWKRPQRGRSTKPRVAQRTLGWKERVRFFDPEWVGSV